MQAVPRRRGASEAGLSSSAAAIDGRTSTSGGDGGPAAPQPPPAEDLLATVEAYAATLARLPDAAAETIWTAAVSLGAYFGVVTTTTTTTTAEGPPPKPPTPPPDSTPEELQQHRERAARLEREVEELRAQLKEAGRRRSSLSGVGEGDEDDDDPLAGAVAGQLTALLADKGRLAAENARLSRQVEGLEELLEHLTAQMAGGVEHEEEQEQQEEDDEQQQQHEAAMAAAPTTTTTLPSPSTSPSVPLTVDGPRRPSTRTYDNALWAAAAAADAAATVAPALAPRREGSAGRLPSASASFSPLRTGIGKHQVGGGGSALKAAGPSPASAQHKQQLQREQEEQHQQRPLSRRRSSGIAGLLADDDDRD